MKTLRSLKRTLFSRAILCMLLAPLLLSACAPSLNKLIEKKNRSAALRKIETAKSAADLEKRDPKGKTPLHLAAEKGEVQIVQALLTKGASLEAADFSGNTALHHAAGCAEDGAANLVAMLLERGAKLEAKNNTGWTPLMVAAHYGNSDAVPKFLEAGAQVNATSNNGETALHLACRHFYISSYMLLATLVGRDPNMPEFGNTHFINECLAVSRSLLQAGAEVNARDSDGETPLFEAIRLSRSAKLVQLLVESGADLTTTSNKGLTPVDFAAFLGKPDLASYLRQQHTQRLPTNVTKIEHE